MVIVVDFYLPVLNIPWNPKDSHGAALGNPFGTLANHWGPRGTVPGSQKAYFAKTPTNRRGERFEAPVGRFEVLARAPGKPVRDRRISLGTLRNRVWVPESILSKDVHESTWGAFLSSRWTF